MTANETIADTIHVPGRDIPAPTYLSTIALAYLRPQPARPPYPAIADKAGWRVYVDAMDQAVAPLLQRVSPGAAAKVEERRFGSASVFDIVPSTADPADRSIVLEMHGGALILCGGELCRLMGVGSALRSTLELEKLSDQPGRQIRDRRRRRVDGACHVERAGGAVSVTCRQALQELPVLSAMWPWTSSNPP